VRIIMLNPITEAVRFGLAYEKMRLEVASYNLAIANIPLQRGEESAVRSVSVNRSFANQLGLPVAVQSQVEQPVKEVQDPSHPFADGKGNVRYANVDATHEMATLVAATRAYEANVRAFNTMHQMASKALEIGGRR
jgi:flagellar basal-body rod protein FlgC